MDTSIERESMLAVCLWNTSNPHRPNTTATNTAWNDLTLLTQNHRQSVYYWHFLTRSIWGFMLMWEVTWHAELQLIMEIWRVLSYFSLFLSLNQCILSQTVFFAVLWLFSSPSLFGSWFVGCSVWSHRDCVQPGALWLSSPPGQCAVQH